MKRKEPVIQNLNSEIFENCSNYYQCSFTKNPKQSIVIKNTVIEQCQFEKIDFNLIELKNTHLVNCVFKNCDLSNLEFDRVSLHCCHFINCKMIGISFIDCSLHDLLFLDVQGRYMNISYGNIRNVLFKNSVLDEASMMEVDVKDLYFDRVSFINGEVFKTKLKGMDLKTTNIDGIRIDQTSLAGIHVDMYQAIALASLLGIIVD